MTTTETSRYRGYDIVPRREWSQWCVSVYPTRSDLPILSRSTLRSLTPRKEDALADARKRIDRILTHTDFLLHRPNEIRATRTGGYADVEMFFDGKVLTVYGKNINGYTQLEAPGSFSKRLKKGGVPL